MNTNIELREICITDTDNLTFADLIRSKKLVVHVDGARTYLTDAAGVQFADPVMNDFSESPRAMIFSGTISVRVKKGSG